jgi:streptogramin lyase
VTYHDEDCLVGRFLLFSAAMVSFVWLIACAHTSFSVYPEQMLGAGASSGATPALKEYVIANPNLWQPFQVAFDANHNLWFNPYGPYLGRMTPGGRITEDRLHHTNPYGIERAYDFTLGPDKRIWFTDFYGKTIGTIKAGRRIRQYPPFARTGYPFTAGITSVGEHLWVVMYCDCYPSIGYLAEITTQPKLIKAIVLLGYYCWPGPVAVGPGNTFWVGNSANCPKITRVTSSGQVTDFPVKGANGVWGVAQGPDGNMWFTAADGPKINAYVGKITSSGQITQYPIKDQGDGIAVGPEGNLWITLPFVGRIISMTPQGHIVANIRLPNAINGSQPRFQDVGITLGPDGNIWFAEPSRNKIGELIFSSRLR